MSFDTNSDTSFVSFDFVTPGIFFSEVPVAFISVSENPNSSGNGRGISANEELVTTMNEKINMIGAVENFIEAPKFPWNYF
ncbi:hypothetical protein LEP1GSC056_1177 [Leptospira borgpetersenii str. Brem 328]|uniref:Uncharacterized protein n=1 Tax=Leptospira borgpetersenii str. Brem 328 TaxID=1049780 RepID=A0ABC9SLV7_LEPBO|nr:hypothetical protein LEP1GSC056_1177 [Leptospira borgpetersenii str. Brem 328]